MITFGNASGPVPPFAPLILSPKSLKVCRPNMGVYIKTKEEFDFYAGEVMKLLSNGHLKITISKVYDLKDAGKAQSDLEVVPCRES
jgi:NADPH:quinone reductase